MKALTPTPLLLRLGLACGLLCGCNPAPTPTSAPVATAPVAVSCAPLRRGDITRSISLPGSINARQSAILCSKTPGYLKTLSVDKGDSVTAGAVLAEIEAPELLAEAPKYQAEMEVAEAGFRRTVEAQKKAPDLVTPASVDEARGKYDVARANFKRIQDLLAYTKITAPFSGIVTRRWVDPGAFIPAATGAVGAAAVVTLMDFSSVRVDVAVPESESPLIRLTLPVTITLEELPGRSFKGNVTRFEYALDPATKTMIAEIEIPNPHLDLRPGMYANVKLGIEQKTGALLAPADAVVTDKTGAFVFIVEESKARKTPVQTGFSDGTSVEILSGLKPEQPLILVGKSSLTSGQTVTVRDGK